MRHAAATFRLSAASIAALVLGAGAGHAVEGGSGAYLLGSRDTLAGIAPPPGNYLTFDLVHLESTAPFLPISGVVVSDVTSSATVGKINLTHSFAERLWGGQPFVTVTLPIVTGSLDFGGELNNGLSGAFSDEQTGMGDLTVTPALGYHDGYQHWVYSASIFVPTGYYEPAKVQIRRGVIEVLSFGRNRWAITPTVAYTYFNTETGLELSGSGGVTFSEKNDETDYQTAPEVVLEAAVLQHLPSGLAFGLTGYAYQQTGDDSGSGADSTRNLTNAKSLQASVQGLGPILTYNTKVGDTSVSMKFKYLSEFNAKRRFESDVVSASVNFAF